MGIERNSGCVATIDQRKSHWDRIYATRKPAEVSWYQADPATSYQFILDTRVDHGAPIIDVGAGASRLVDVLLAAGFTDLTVLDVCSVALAEVRDRLGSRAQRVRFVEADVTRFRPDRQFAVWHDRAVFHFLTDRGDRRAYLAALRRALRPRGHVIIATFGMSGPSRCSGLDVVRYSAETLAAELGHAFTLRQSCEQTHTTPSGVGQDFLFTLFQANE